MAAATASRRRVAFFRAPLAIARNTVGEAVHHMIFQVILFFGLLFLVAGTFFTYMAPQEEHKMITDLGLSIIAAFGLLMCLYLGIYTIQPEIERRTIYALLAKPVKRWEFMVGKYLGALVVLLVTVAIMGAVLLVTLYAREGLLSLPLMVAVGTTFMALGMMLAVIMMVSTVASPLMTIIVTVVVWILGYLQSYMKQLADHAEQVGSKVILETLNTILPNIELFDIRVNVVENIPVSAHYLVLMARYGFLYTLVVLILAVIFFNEKQV